MKKILFLAMAAAAMAGCSQNEEIENAGQKAEIEFGTVVKAGTKAVITTNDNFDKFTVRGYKTSDAMGPTVQLETGFIDNLELEKSSGWKYTNTFYWPLTGKVQFFATSPAQSFNLPVGYPTFDYTIKGVASQEDLLAANVIDQAKGAGAIILPFQHLLTQVNFTIKGATPDFTYTVSKLVIKGAKDKATFTFDGTATVGEWKNIVASVPAPEYVYQPETAVSVAPTADEPDIEQKLETIGNALFMLMPQDLSGVTLDITYTAAPTANTTAYTYNDTKTINLTGTWGMAQNIRYTLALTNDASPVEFGIPTVGGWENKAGTGETPVTSVSN